MSKSGFMYQCQIVKNKIKYTNCTNFIFERRYLGQVLYFKFVFAHRSLVEIIIGVNKGRHVTLKYLSKLIKINRKLRLFIGPGQNISLICVVVK